MKTVVYNVAYKTEPGRKQYLQPFVTQQAAISFAYEIEATGGVAIVVPVETYAERLTPPTPFIWAGSDDHRHPSK